MKLSTRVEGQPRRMRSKLSEACALCEADLVLFLLKRRNSVVTRVHAHSRLAPSLVQRLSFELGSCSPPGRAAIGRGSHRVSRLLRPTASLEAVAVGVCLFWLWSRTNLSRATSSGLRILEHACISPEAGACLQTSGGGHQVNGGKGVRHGNSLLRPRRDLSLVGFRQCRDGVCCHGAVRSYPPARVEDARARDRTPSTRLNVSVASFSSAAGCLSPAFGSRISSSAYAWLASDSLAARSPRRSRGALRP